MYSYTSNHNDLSISQPIIRKHISSHNNNRYPNKDPPKRDLNYYNDRRKNIHKLSSTTNNNPNKRSINPTNTNQRYSTPIRSNDATSNTSNTERKFQLNANHPLMYLSQNDLFKKETSLTTIKAKHVVYDEETSQLQKENAYLKRENIRLKEEIDSIERSSNQITIENKNELEGIRMNLYEQLEQSRNEIKIFEKNKENLNAQIMRYKKEIQKLIEDNIKLKNINQEQSILINSSANTSFIAHGFVVKKEIAFTIANNNKKKKLYTNVFPIQSKNNITTMHISSSNECSQTEMLINSIEKENYVLSETITDLESKVDSYILSKLTEEQNNNNNNSDNNNNNSNNEINTLLYSFYSKIASLLNKSIIDYTSIPLNKKMFIISTSSILTEIKTYQLMLQKTSFHNYLKK